MSDAFVSRLRWTGVALVVLSAIGSIAVVAYLGIASLRDDAQAQRGGEALVARVRLELTEANALLWQSASFASPNYTLRTQLGDRGRRLVADAEALAARPGRHGTTDIRRAVASYARHAAQVQRLLTAGRSVEARAVANQEANTASRLLAADLGRRSRSMRAQAAELEARADAGVRWILTGAGALIAALLGLAGWLSARGERRRREALRSSERRFRSLVEKAADGIVLIDDERRVLDATPAVRAMLGHDIAALRGRRIADLVAEDQREELEERLAAVDVGEGTGAPTHWTARHADGRRIQIEAIATNLRHDPSIGAVVLNLRDITERQRMEDRLRHQAFHDGLTGLPNRSLFEDRLRQALARRRRTGAGVALLLVDIDDFKMVNDHAGHAGGDEVLRRVATVLDDQRRASDTAARLGGDEFAVLLEDAGDASAVETIARRLLDAVAATVDAGDGRRCSLSIGGVLARQDADSAETLMRDADIALYGAKRAGKNRAELFDGELLEAARRRLQLRHDLAHAEKRGELDVHYQPVVGLAEGQVIGFEALVRWRHPELGMVSPAEFIPLAEETGDIATVGRFVLRRACAALATWPQDPALAPVSVGVNVSARQLAEPTFVGEVLAEVDRHGIDPARLVIELTESAMVEDVELTRERVAAMRDAGLRVAVDDFGTGYSSLSYLRDLQLDAVKIDRSFVARLDERREDATLVRSIIELGQALGLRVVAEGIEREAQLALLRDSGCDSGQGFLFGRPAPESEIRGRAPAGELTGALNAERRSADH